MDPVFFDDPSAFRAWLEQHHGARLNCSSASGRRARAAPASIGRNPLTKRSASAGSTAFVAAWARRATRSGSRRARPGSHLEQAKRRASGGAGGGGADAPGGSRGVRTANGEEDRVYATSASRRPSSAPPSCEAFRANRRRVEVLPVPTAELPPHGDPLGGEREARGHARAAVGAADRGLGGRVEGRAAATLVRIMGGAGFEPAKAEPMRLQRIPFDRSGIPPNVNSRIVKRRTGIDLEPRVLLPQCD